MSTLIQPLFQLLKKGIVISRSECNGFGLFSNSLMNPPSPLFTLEYIVILLKEQTIHKENNECLILTNLLFMRLFDQFNNRSSALNQYYDNPSQNRNSLLIIWVRFIRLSCSTCHLTHNWIRNSRQSSQGRNLSERT